MIEVRQVFSRKEQKEFLQFPLKIYKDNPYFVPPLYLDEKQIFDKNYMYYDQAEAVYFNAYKDGVMVGRISGILQHAANAKWKQNQVRFTRFDAIDDQEVADALFAAVENWARGKNADEIVGPLGFSDLEREGLLIEGFDQLSTFEEQYNYNYYQRLIENCGYVKDVDWIERRIRVPAEGLDPKTRQVLSDLLSRYNLHYGTARNTRDFVRKYAAQIFNIWDEAYDKLYGTVPFADKVRKQMLVNFKLLIDMRYICVLLDENDNLVAFGFCFPSISKALQKSGGRLTPSTLHQLLDAIRRPKAVDLAIIGVTEKYKNTGVAYCLVKVFCERMIKYNIEYAETNLMLENNCPIQNLWKRFDTVQHKRRRCFIKTIK